MSTSRNRSREMRMKRQQDITALDPGEAMNVARKTRNKGGYISQFRSNLTSTVAFFKGVHLNNAHLDCLKRTPVFNLVLPFPFSYISREYFLYMPLEMKEAEDGVAEMRKDIVEQKLM
ncbi:hypothetical protein ACP275_08G212000 [Erythranthe tilingii]